MQPSDCYPTLPLGSKMMCINISWNLASCTTARLPPSAAAVRGDCTDCGMVCPPPPLPWPCTRSQHHSVPSRNLHPLMVPPFLQPHPDLQSAVGNAPLSSKHPAQLPTTDCLLSIISPMGGQPSDAPALSLPSPLQQGGQSSNAPALSPPSPLPQGGQPIALALSPPSPPPQGGQPSDAPGLSLSSSTLLLCPSDSTLSICHLNS
ncbi:hypothetical protein ACOMHN_020453 [Nucella lapillus]